MIRLILYLLGKTDYENCKGCEVLKQQLAIANAEKKEAIDTVISIIKPKSVTPVELNKTAPIAGVFSRRQNYMEDRDRKEAQARSSTFSAGNQEAKPSEEDIVNTVAELEREAKG